MDLFDGLRAFAALLVTIGIMLGVAWAVRRHGGVLGLKPAGATDDLAVVSWKTLDVRRKLAVVRWDGREHLLCLGPTGDLKVAERPAPAPQLSSQTPTAPMPRDPAQ
jgi:flagellar protein FliO/FliZ